MSEKQFFVKEAMRITDEAKERDIVLRFIGAVAFEKHCTPIKSASIRSLASNRKLTDLDFIAYSSQWDKVIGLFADMGYAFEQTHALLHGHDRILLKNPKNTLIPHVDVFFDRLFFCHSIDFKKNRRLEVDYPTISLADLLLEKMQIVEINEKDVVDTMILLGEHNVGMNDQNQVNMNYINALLSNDWGFYYTVTTNLKKIRGHFLQNNEILTDEDKARIASNVNDILDAIERGSKSLGWRVRSKIGTSKKWYNDVEEVRLS